MGVSGPARARLAAAIAHTLRFETWRSLARTEALDAGEAADLMVTFAKAAADVRVRSEQSVSTSEAGNS